MMKQPEQSLEDYWTRLLNRTPSTDSVVYAVKTTGIYCRFGCSSRTPKKENVEFYTSYLDAEQHGYRPCQRCLPSSYTRSEKRRDLMISACRRLENEQPVPSSSELSQEMGMSSQHFQRLFKTELGLTPKEYASAHQAKNFRSNLSRSKSITDAIYDSGYSSSSRAHEANRGRFSMTVRDFKQGAKGVHIQYQMSQCSLGWLLVAFTEKGICAVELGDSVDSLNTKIKTQFSKADLQEIPEERSTWIQDVVKLIDNPHSTHSELPLDIQGTVFQEKVWKALRDIPIGRTVTYSELAQTLGMPQSTRAVANACAKNRLAVVIPCHRVIRKDGGLGGYRWGIQRKIQLLQQEQSNSQ